MRTTIIAALLAAAALPAVASDLCQADKADWRPVEDLKTELTDKGWTISNVKETNGCYEVYGRDADGQRVEIFFDPATFEEMGSDE